MGRTRRIPPPRCSQPCEVESGQRCVRRHLGRPRRRRSAGYVQVAQGHRHGAGDRHRGQGRDAQSVAVVRWSAPRHRVAVPEARWRSGVARGRTHGSRLTEGQRAQRRVHRADVGQGDLTVTDASAVDAYYDPFDFAIDDDPYPIWKRLRDDAPLYHNEKFNFYALSRYEDVSRELPNWETYRSGRGSTMDVIMSGIEVPPGVILFEDPPLHDLHRRVLSKVFTP